MILRRLGAVTVSNKRVALQIEGLVSGAPKLFIDQLRTLVLIRHEAERARVSLRQLLLVDDDEATSVTIPRERLIDRRLLRILEKIAFLLRALEVIMRPRRLLLQVVRMEAAGRGSHRRLLLTLGCTDLLLLSSANVPRWRLLHIVQFGILLRPHVSIVWLLRRPMGGYRPASLPLAATRVLGAFGLFGNDLGFVCRLHQILLQSFELIWVNLDFSDSFLLLLGRHIHIWL